MEKVFLNITETSKPYYSKESKYINSNGKVVYFDSSIVPVYIKGKMKYLVHSAEDVTEKVINRKLVIERNKELEAIMENMSDELIICDKNGQPTMINKASRKHPFFNGTELTNLNNTLKEAEYFDIDGNLIPLENLPLKRIARGEKFSEYRVDSKINNNIIRREASGTPIYDNKGDFIAGVLVSRDISDRLKNEENKLLKAQYDILSRTIGNLDLGYAIISYPDFKIKYMNSNAYDDLKKFNRNITPISSSIGKRFF